jgi:hypothetical protein
MRVELIRKIVQVLYLAAHGWDQGTVEQGAPRIDACLPDIDFTPGRSTAKEAMPYVVRALPCSPPAQTT